MSRSSLRGPSPITVGLSARIGAAIALSAFAASLSLFPIAAAAEQRPLWEVGMGVGAIRFPDYRGADREQNYVLPVPLFIYRGEFLKADRNGIRGLFFNSDRVEVNLSLAASAPVDSSDNPARAGMPDLNPTVEIGPSLDINLWRASNRQAKLDLRLPLQTGVTLERRPESIGLQFAPRFNLDFRDPMGLAGWNLGLATGPIFADKKRHRYFYSVQSQQATPTRPTYEAGGGYAGTQFLAAVSKRYPSFWVGGFVRYDTLKGAVFEDSPLMKRDHYFAAGIAVSWIFAESSRRVEAAD